MSKGSALSRAVRFFREADLDVARVAFTLVTEVVNDRLKLAAAAKQSQARAASTPRKPRRTKLQMAADAAIGGAAGVTIVPEREGPTAA